MRSKIKQQVVIQMTMGGVYNSHTLSVHVLYNTLRTNQRIIQCRKITHTTPHKLRRARHMLCTLQINFNVPRSRNDKTHNYQKNSTPHYNFAFFLYFAGVFA